MLKKQRIITLLVILLFCLGLVAACGKAKPNPLAQPPEQGKPPAVTPLPQGNGDQNSQTKKDSGSYLGQIDSNSIEIKISGVPENVAPRAFQLAEPLKENFEKYGLKTNDQVLFTYTEKAGERPVITDISKIK